MLDRSAHVAAGHLLAVYVKGDDAPLVGGGQVVEGVVVGDGAAGHQLDGGAADVQVKPGRPYRSFGGRIRPAVEEGVHGHEQGVAVPAPVVLLNHRVHVAPYRPPAGERRTDPPRQRDGAGGEGRRGGHLQVVAAGELERLPHLAGGEGRGAE